MKILTLSKKEARDILYNRIYILLVFVQLIIILGAYSLAIVSSIAADPALIDQWGGERFLSVGLNSSERGGILDESLRREGLNVKYFDGSAEARSGLGSDIVAFVYLNKDGDIGVDADTSSVFYTVIREKLTNALSWYSQQKRFREAGLSDTEIKNLETPIKLNIIPRNMEDFDGLALESSYFVEIMYGFIIPFIVFLPFFLGSNMVTDSVVGEKERKTFEVLLMVPLSETRVILGKILPVLSFSFLQSILWIAVLTALKVPIYNIGLLMVLLLFTGLGFIGIGMFISTLADSTKEANSAITVFLFFATFILFVPLFMDTGFFRPFIDLIPSVLIVKLSSTPIIKPEFILDMIPSMIVSLMIFGASIASFRREGVIRL